MTCIQLSKNIKQQLLEYDAYTNTFGVLIMELNHNTNVIFLTGYSNYAMDAWATKASGFLLKPLLIDDVKMQLAKLRHPVGGME